MFAMLSVGVKGGSYVRFFMTHTEIILLFDLLWEVFDMFEASDMV